MVVYYPYVEHFYLKILYVFKNFYPRSQWLLGGGFRNLHFIAEESEAQRRQSHSLGSG